MNQPFIRRFYPIHNKMECKVKKYSSFFILHSSFFFNFAPQISFFLLILSV